MKTEALEPKELTVPPIIWHAPIWSSLLQTHSLFLHCAGYCWPQRWFPSEGSSWWNSLLWVSDLPWQVHRHQWTWGAFVQPQPQTSGEHYLECVSGSSKKTLLNSDSTLSIHPGWRVGVRYNRVGCIWAPREAVLSDLKGKKSQCLLSGYHKKLCNEHAWHRIMYVASPKVYLPPLSHQTLTRYGATESIQT